MKKMMCALLPMMFVGCVNGMPLGVSEDAREHAVTETTDEFGTVVSPLSTPCAQESWKSDCAKELAMAAGDECVKWPGGVWCHPVDKICVLTVDADCYFDKGVSTCSSDADCEDGNSCTFDACIGDDAGNWCYSTDFPDGSPCGYSKALDALMVCEAHPQLSAPACVPDLDDEPECTITAECDDGVACTFDLCDDITGNCSHAPIPECCQANGECGGEKPYCVDTLFSPVPGVKWCQPCLQDDTSSGCAQGDICFWGIEEAPSPPLPEQGKSVFWCAQCVTDFDCTDDDPCTIDTCMSDDTCTHTPDPACDEPAPECETDEECAHMDEVVCDEADNLHTFSGICEDGICTKHSSASLVCEYGCVDSSCLPKPECVIDEDCSDAPQFDTVACDNSACTYGNPQPVVKIVWDMPADWWVDYVRLEGTFCEDGAQPASQQSDNAIKSGTCTMSSWWGPFLTTGMEQQTTVWSTKDDTIENAKQDPMVTAFTTIPSGTRWLIVNWVWSFNNHPKQWLCNDMLGPKDYGDTWDGKATWGEHAFYAPDGTKLPVKVEPGNQLQGCLFWIDVSPIAALN